MAGRAVGVVVSPLTGQRLDLNASVFNDLVSGEGHVRVNVPVLHALNDVDRAVVVLNHAVQEGAFSPVVVAGIGDHATGQVGCWAVEVALHVALTKGVRVFCIAVDTERAVDAVVHDHAACFHAAVAPHQLVDANQTRHGHDGGEVRVAEGGGLPGG